MLTQNLFTLILNIKLNIKILFNNLLKIILNVKHKNYLLFTYNNIKY